MMTEDEARNKWCPMVRYGNEAGCNRNSMPNGCTSPVNCIASDCACWVWDRDSAFVNGKLQDNVKLNTGHCGLIQCP